MGETLVKSRNKQLMLNIFVLQQMCEVCEEETACVHG